MPIYVYRCEMCDKEIEVIQSITDAPLKICTECGGELEQQMTTPAIVFKGPGFYETDYKTKQP